MNKLKEECKKYVLDKSQSGAYDLAGSIEEEIDELFNWINQNYISKEEILNLECLKEEEIDIHIFDGHNDILMCRNQLRNEIKKEIEKI